MPSDWDRSWGWTLGSWMEGNTGISARAHSDTAPPAPHDYTLHSHVQTPSDAILGSTQTLTAPHRARTGSPAPLWPGLRGPGGMAPGGLLPDPALPLTWYVLLRAHCISLKSSRDKRDTRPRCSEGCSTGHHAPHPLCPQYSFYTLAYGVISKSENTPLCLLVKSYVFQFL